MSVTFRINIPFCCSVIFLVTIASANEREASSLSQYLSVYRYPLFRGTITHFCKYDERLSRANGWLIRESIFMTWWIIQFEWIKRFSMFYQRPLMAAMSRVQSLKSFASWLKKNLFFGGEGGLSFEWFASKKKRLKKIHRTINTKKVKLKGFE